MLGKNLLIFRIESNNLNFWPKKLYIQDIVLVALTLVKVTLSDQTGEKKIQLKFRAKLVNVCMIGISLRRNKLP